jgi:hypothetical protein
MAYLVNQTRLHSLTINGVDYTESLISWTASDGSSNKAGLIATNGTLVLGQKPGGYDVEDYDRDNFKRGTEVILQVTYPGGTTARHPRGLLYVMTTSYSPENNQLTIELGCRLALAKLTDDTDVLVSLSPIYLDPTQRSYSNVSAAFVSAGQYLYQNNQGNLVSGTFFDGDSTESVAAGNWTSVLGVTALSAQPLAGSSPVPDEIELSYRIPSDSVANDQKGKIDIETTESYYYVTYPAVMYQRVGGTLNDIGGTATATASTGQASACGNTPAKPADNGTPSCNEGYETVQTPLILPAKRIETRRSEYNGPGGQLSRVYNEVRGPALEANGQYFSDKFAYCRYTWATACQPNGACPTDGEEEILLSYQEQLNYYGSANELVKTVTDTYNTVLSAAQPFNWRSGNVNGVPQGFQTLSTTDMYRVSSVIVDYFYDTNANKQETTTYTSITSRQSGITGVIDALSGIKTFQRRISTTISANPLIPDIVNNSTTSTVDKSTRLRLYTGRYTTPPTESGPYVLKEQIPVPLLFDNPAEINAAVAAYSNHLERFVKGDAYGMQIGESLRQEIATNWHPGMPFRYYDSSKNKLMAMRMDATAWGVNDDGSALVTNGIWIGYSNGTVTVDHNLVGDSRPDMGGGIVPPVGPGNAPSVSGETVVDSGSYAFEVDVHFMLQDLATWVAPSYPADASYVVQPHLTFTVWCGGLTVTGGDVLDVGSNGTIPVDYLGSLVTANATVVNADLFA